LTLALASVKVGNNDEVQARFIQPFLDLKLKAKILNGDILANAQNGDLIINAWEIPIAVPEMEMTAIFHSMERWGKAPGLVSRSSHSLINICIKQVPLSLFIDRNLALESFLCFGENRSDSSKYRPMVRGIGHGI
jgi:hypothetical protein